MVKRISSDYPDLEDSEDEFSLTFMHCLGREEPLPGEKFNNTFQPVALAISTVFMILVLIVFILHAKLRESLSGKITKHGYQPNHLNDRVDIACTVHCKKPRGGW